MPQQAGCLFCKIVGRESKASIVFEDDVCLAFLDHRPVFPGHVLLIPKRHAEIYSDLVPGELSGFAAAAQKLEIAVERAMEAHGSFMAINNKVSQSVPHLHMHIVPRRFKDGLRGFFWPRQKYSAEMPIESVAEKIKAQISMLAMP